MRFGEAPRCDERPARSGRAWLAAAWALIVGLGVAWRCSSWQRVFVLDWAMFQGPDPYYHLRRVQLAMAHGGIPPIFDAYFNHPEGVEAYTPHLFPALLALAARWALGPTTDPRLLSHVMVWLGPVCWLLIPPCLYLLARLIFPHDCRRIGLIAAAAAAISPAMTAATLLGCPDTQCVEAIAALLLPALSLAVVARPGAARVAALAGAGMAAFFSWSGVLMYLLLVAGALLGLRALLARHPAGAALRSASGALACAYGCMAAGSLLYGVLWPTGVALDRVGAGTAAALALCALAWALPGRTRFGAWAAPVLLCLGVLALAQATGARAAGEAGAWTATVTELEPLLGRRGEAWARSLWLFTPAVVLLPVAMAHISRRARGAAASAQVGAGLLLVLLAFAAASALLFVKQAHVFAAYWTLALAYGTCVVLGWAGRRQPLVWLALALLLAPGALMALQPSQRFSHPLSARWQCLFYLRDHTPPAGDPLFPVGKPAYGVLSSFWDEGHFIAAIAERPTVASGLHETLAANRATAEFCLASSAEQALAVLERFDARYYLWSYNIDILPAYARWLGKTDWRAVIERDGRYETSPEIFDLFQVRLAVSDGGAGGVEGRRWDATGALRLLYERGDVLRLRGLALPRYKVYERVRGCTLEVVADPHVQVSARLSLRSNLNRPFAYEARAVTDASGTARLAVAYASRDFPAGGVVAESRYTIRAGTRQAEVEVDERDVQQGGTVRVELR